MGWKDKSGGSYLSSSNALRVGSGSPLQCSYLENSMDRGTWWVTVQSQSWTRLSTQRTWLILTTLQHRETPALQGRKLKFKLWPTCPELASRQESSDPKPESDRCPHLRFFFQNTFMSHEVLSFQPGIVEISLLRKWSFFRIHEKRRKMDFAQQNDISWF